MSPAAPVSMAAAALLVSAVLAPLLACAALAIPAWRERLATLTGWTAVPALLAAWLWPADSSLPLPWLLTGTRLGLDDTGRVFLFFTAVLWASAGWYAARYLGPPHRDPRRAPFTAFFLVSMAGNLGLVVAQDAASFFLFFTLMSFAAYGLVVHNRDAAARRAARIYLILVVLGEVLLFSGIAVLVAGAGTTELAQLRGAAPDGWTLALLIAGFGIKAGALPLHVWLPLAHPAAPVPASAVLSGAMIKAGLLGWLRFLPLGVAALPSWGDMLIVLGLGAAFYGVVLGLAQRDPKTVLAYSSISQMGTMTVGVGVGLAMPAAWPLLSVAVLVYALHHAFAKGALFLGVGVLRHAGGRGVQWVRAGVTLAALALAGLPLTSGAIAKGALKEGLNAAGMSYQSLALWLSLAAVGTVLLMARLLRLLWAEGSATRAAGGARGLLAPWLLATAGGTLVLWLWPVPMEAVGTLKPAALWSSLWPLLAGAVLYAPGAVILRYLPSIEHRLPAGDVLVPVERLGRFVGPRLGREIEAAALWPRSLVDRLLKGLPDMAAAAHAGEWVERRLQRWLVVGTLFVGFTLTLYLMLWA